MNIRFSSAFDTANVRKMPAAIRNPDSRTRLILSVLGVLVLLFVVWRLVAAPAGNKPRALPPPPVRIGQVAQSNVTVTEHTLGTVIANATVDVTARVTGQLLSAAFKEGDIVHVGQLLFQIDPRPYQATLAQAKAQMAKDQASLVSARNDARRYSALLAQGAASQQQVDQTVAAAKGFEATVQADKAAIQAAALNVGYTTIRSPIDGKTGPILVQPGNMVMSGSGGSPASGSGTNGSATSTSSPSGGGNSNTLVVITQVQPVKVSFSLSQSDLPSIQARWQQHALTATVDRHDAEHKLIEAPVDFVGNAVSNTTGTIELRATYPNSDSALIPGQLVDVTVALNTLDHALTVPHDAVNIGPDSRFVYRIGRDNKAELVPVKVLFDAGATTAVSGNLRPGDKVVTDGQLRVVPGSPVSIAGRRSAKRP
ncbi:MAG: efflux RND transporter periplasmic adaptor subunit [Alphaproteobacteria bacterium]|nr:efflux RND transporter periplasmic adaptor subunit [Alphaproteobacteria bacterium]